ncbi:unnamed protein product [Pleuronectes platessa]|uniref:Uncharacterized protein n=1 Tax=Pleuronectes platessa TaxID=8262 RepID=A0A9N7U853_PLEPL|nr:unnamed protein product [Pleuronectes platessa]
MKECEGMQLFKQLFDLVVTQCDSLRLKYHGDHSVVHPSGRLLSCFGPLCADPIPLDEEAPRGWGSGEREETLSGMEDGTLIQGSSCVRSLEGRAGFVSQAGLVSVFVCSRTQQRNRYGKSELTVTHW